MDGMTHGMQNSRRHCLLLSAARWQVVIPLKSGFSRSVASRHSAEKRNPEDSLAAHTVPHRDAESRRKDKGRLQCDGFLDSASGRGTESRR